jgi:hypothetical protein
MDIDALCASHDLDALLEMSEHLRSAAFRHHNPLRQLLGIETGDALRAIDSLGNAKWFADTLMHWLHDAGVSAEEIPVWNAGPSNNHLTNESLAQFSEASAAVQQQWYEQIKTEITWRSTMLTLLGAGIELYADIYTCWHPIVVRFNLTDEPSRELAAEAMAIRDSQKDPELVMRYAVAKLQLWHEELGCSTIADFARWLMPRPKPIALSSFYSDFCSNDDLTILGW